MPLYEFYCSDCRERFERLTTYAASGAGVTCPACQGSRVRKLFSVFATAGSHGDDGGYDFGDDSSESSSGGCACGGACACGGH